MVTRTSPLDKTYNTVMGTPSLIILQECVPPPHPLQGWYHCIPELQLTIELLHPALMISAPSLHLRVLNANIFGT